MCSSTMLESGVSENSNKLIHNSEREIIRSAIERFDEEKCKCFLKNYQVAWPFRREPGTGRTLLTTAVCAVEWLGYRDVWTQSTNAGVKEAQGYFPIPLGLFMVECRADKARHACPKWHAETFPWHAAFTAVSLLETVTVKFIVELSKLCRLVNSYGPFERA